MYSRDSCDYLPDIRDGLTSLERIVLQRLSALPKERAGALEGTLCRDRKRMLTIRAEKHKDIPVIHQINTTAFGQPNEADLVDRLRDHRVLTVSLVAVLDSCLVGHIALSPVTITSDTATIEALGLAPMAVLPAYQRRGIGSQLVEAGLHACHKTSYGVVVVLGHPHYYPRFGFTPAKPLGIMWEHDAPEEAFMVKEIQERALAQTRGIVKYRPEFDTV